MIDQQPITEDEMLKELQNIVEFTCKNKLDWRINFLPMFKKSITYRQFLDGQKALEELSRLEIVIQTKNDDIFKLEQENQKLKEKEKEAKKIVEGLVNKTAELQQENNNLIEQIKQLQQVIVIGKEIIKSLESTHQSIEEIVNNDDNFIYEQKTQRELKSKLKGENK